jgi:hypothetical protein
MTNITGVALIALVGAIGTGLWLAKKFSRKNRKMAKPIAPAVTPIEKAPKITLTTADDINLEDPVRKNKREKDRERKKRRRARKRLMQQQSEQS